PRRRRFGRDIGRSQARSELACLDYETMSQRVILSAAKDPRDGPRRAATGRDGPHPSMHGPRRPVTGVLRWAQDDTSTAASGFKYALSRYQSLPSKAGVVDCLASVRLETPTGAVFKPGS